MREIKTETIPTTYEEKNGEKFNIGINNEIIIVDNKYILLILKKVLVLKKTQ